ncbi:CMGC/SRPK protein kinase [Mycena indigotica]|uniref:non-specific serine/threonine protein kinase n=1 Tax=Mycena indigotica TaxID=2126181 RepID=A0A8H6SUW4_9AGAR|nr:CMGC/SRPK protein kinase [Mycena indigotica]KAF7306620.1 CMGC/SRPK protein kinase [Mycena indigotica]
MAPGTSQQPAKYQYVYTAGKPKILPVDEVPQGEESPAEYNTGGYLPVRLTDTFKSGRYTVVRKLGWGHFSTVWLVRDTERNRHSALKVVKSAGRYAETARDEIKLLSRVAAASPLHPGRQHIVSFMDSFSHEGPESSHICIVFEPLGENLLALIERNRRKGVPRALVKIIARQVLLGLEYLHDECDLVHTDIKPENIPVISIPDVEEYICSELIHSPSPTSRRVGVPPPKTRPSVSIPQTLARSRRQVQIFDSQPLASPGSRSSGLGSHSGPNSVSSSYVSPMQMSHMAKYGVNGLSSSAPKVPSGLSTSAPRNLVPVSSKSTPVTAASSHANSPISPPSTSSSSSSISSTPFTAADSVNTPPTSLSNSFASAMVGLLQATKEPGKSKAVSLNSTFKEPAGLPMKNKRQSVMESELEDALSTSWKEKLGLTSASLSHKANSSISAKPKLPRGHTRSSSGISVSSSWKDPGLSAPAPAVVVSAVVRADGEQQGDYFQLANSLSESQAPTPASSQSSSATVTKAHPSPNLDSQPGKAAIKVSNPNPSLLSQTAPRTRTTVAAHGVLRVSPPSSHISQLSAHMHVHAPPPSPSNGRVDRTSLPLSPSSATSLTPTAASPPMASPPSDLPLPHLHTPALALPQPRPPLAPQISVKIADLGNATPSKKHFTEDIQTRQYRSPEAIIGRKDWGTRADIWSVACLVFELLTAEFLFDPQGQIDLFTKDDDHMAQIIELLGDFPLEVKMGGKYSHELFDSSGSLRYIKTLKPWPLQRVMTEKYLWSDDDAAVLCTFLEPMLAVDHRNRASAKDMLDHRWLEVLDVDDDAVGEW